MTRFWDGQTDGRTDGVTAHLDLLSPSAMQVINYHEYFIGLISMIYHEYLVVLQDPITLIWIQHRDI